MISPKKLKIGSPVSGDDFFFPREDIIKRLRKTLLRDHVSFLAPRRTGKTSILRYLETEAPQDHPHYFINLETITSPAQMVAQLISPLFQVNPRWKKVTGGLGEKVKNFVGSIESFDVVGTGLKLRS